MCGRVHKINTIRFDDDEFNYEWYSDQKLSGSPEQPISFDTETRRMRPYRPAKEGEDVNDIANDPLDIPDIAVGTAYDGSILLLIHPDKLSQFFRQHKDQNFVGQNIVFDFNVCMKHLKGADKELLWSLGDNNKLADTMILDMLIQLATGKYKGRGGSAGKEDTKLIGANLGVLAEEWQVGEIDKKDPYRLRYGELVGLSQSQIESHPEYDGFAGYALGDTIATFRIYRKQRKAALKIMRESGWAETAKRYEIRPDAVKLWGVLSEYIQVRASISLSALSRTQLKIDQVKRAELEAEARRCYDEYLKVLVEREPELVKRYSKRYDYKIKMTTKNLPQFNQSKLVGVLEAEAERLKVPVVISNGKRKGTSTSTKAWALMTESSPFIDAWVGLEQVAQLLQFLVGLNGDRVYSSYNLLMRTGRTSAKAYKYGKELILPSLNVQQIPKPDKNDNLWDVRKLITAESGHVLYTCDIVYAELRTLAASCIARFGFSKLADTIKDHTLHGGLDPHERASCSMLAMTEEEFKSKSKSERKKMRQNAKPFSFGCPGGLGAKKLCLYAATNYNVIITPKQAKEAKEAFVRAYPEIGSEYHLRDYTREGLAYQFGIPVSTVPKLQEFFKIRISKWLKDEGLLSTGEKDRFWDLMESLALRSPYSDTLLPLVQKREVSWRVRDLFNFRAVNLNGLIRGNVNYSQRANFPFQSNLSCAAKEVLWMLLRRGYMTKIYLHDEFVIQLPITTSPSAIAKLEKDINSVLEFNIGEGVPSAIEGSIAKSWQKL